MIHFAFFLIVIILTSPSFTRKKGDLSSGKEEEESCNFGQP